MAEASNDITLSNKQSIFVKEVLKGIYGKTDCRTFFYGGGIRGGKTYACLSVAHAVAIRFPGMRIHVVRKDIPSLNSTTLPSYKKIIGSDLQYIDKWSNKPGNQSVTYRNGSVVYFFPESFDKDKDLDRFKGLETNMFILEELGEMQEATFTKCLERVGSYILPKGQTPCGVILATFNPSHNWLRDTVYEPYIKRVKNPDDPDGLNKSWFYLEATAKDNPHVTKDQWNNWALMDEIAQKRFIGGDWYASAATGRFLYAFEYEKHVGIVKYNEALPLWISFDFNINPMTCLFIQISKDKKEFHILKEFRMLDADIGKFAAWIKTQLPLNKFGKPVYDIQITGDPSGSNRSALLGGNQTYYSIIKNVMGLHASQLQHVPKHGAFHEASQVACNAVISRIPTFVVDAGCKFLIDDFSKVSYSELTRINSPQKIKEADSGKDTTMGHFLDCFRYAVQTNYPNFLTFDNKLILTQEEITALNKKSANEKETKETK